MESIEAAKVNSLPLYLKGKWKLVKLI